MGMLELRGHTVLVICALQGGSHRCIGDGDTYVVVVIVVNGGGHSTFKVSTSAAVVSVGVRMINSRLFCISAATWPRS